MIGNMLRDNSFMSPKYTTTELEKQLAVNTFLHWLEGKHRDQIAKLAEQYERDIPALGADMAEGVLKERVVRMLIP